VIAGFDHVTIAARDVPRAAEAWRRVLGRTPPESAATPRFQLDNIALEIAEAGDHVTEGFADLGFAVDDLSEACRTLTRRGAPCAEDPARPGNATVSAEATFGVPIRLVQTPGAERAGARPDTLSAIDHVVIRTLNPDRAVAFYGARLGLDLRLDRSNPAWNARLLFFRCGDAVVEISADPSAAPTDGPDRLTGLAWRTRDPDAARARLAAEGLDVSEVRAGRKPGTRVFTIRPGVLGAAALVIGPNTGSL
jgi:catechol 2,3-dioxygenase-like lactoylglutathione lyase family enzyme